MGFVWNGNYTDPKNDPDATRWDLTDEKGKVLASFDNSQKQAVDRLINLIGRGGGISTRWPIVET